MRLFLVLSFVLFGLSSFAQDSWRAPESAKKGLKTRMLVIK